MKPACAFAFDSTSLKKPIVSVSPRIVFPSVRTRRNSESRVNRLDFGKRKCFCISTTSYHCGLSVIGQARRLPYWRLATGAVTLQNPAAPVQAKVFPVFLEEDFAKQTRGLRRR